MSLVRIVCISDTHGQHANLSVPDGDILIHAGDFAAFGETPIEIIDFN
jgi:predicted phosphodiesterase